MAACVRVHSIYMVADLLAAVLMYYMEEIIDMFEVGERQANIVCAHDLNGPCRGITEDQNIEHFFGSGVSYSLLCYGLLPCNYHLAVSAPTNCESIHH